jgi:hypothetical protein
MTVWGQTGAQQGVDEARSAAVRREAPRTDCDGCSTCFPIGWPEPYALQHPLVPGQGSDLLRGSVRFSSHKLGKLAVAASA